MIDWFFGTAAKLWPWSRIKKLEELVTDLKDNIEDNRNWSDTATSERDQFKDEADTLRKENYNLRAEVNQFKATLSEFKNLCEKYD